MPRLSASLFAVSAFVFLATSGTAANADTGMSTDEALELAKKTGRPIFAVAGSET